MRKTDKLLIGSGDAPALAAARLRGLQEGPEVETQRHSPKLAVLPSGRSDPTTPGHGLADGSDSRSALKPKPKRKTWIGHRHKGDDIDARIGELQIPFAWLEKVVLSRLQNCLDLIDKIPLKERTHLAWRDARTFIYSAFSDAEELKRMARQMLAPLQSNQVAICHIKSQKVKPKRGARKPASRK